MGEEVEEADDRPAVSGPSLRVEYCVYWTSERDVMLKFLVVNDGREPILVRDKFRTFLRLRITNDGKHILSLRTFPTTETDLQRAKRFYLLPPIEPQKTFHLNEEDDFDHLEDMGDGMVAYINRNLDGMLGERIMPPTADFQTKLEATLTVMEVSSETGKLQEREVKVVGRQRTFGPDANVLTPEEEARFNAKSSSGSGER